MLLARRSNVKKKSRREAETVSQKHAKTASFPYFPAAGYVVKVSCKMDNSHFRTSRLQLVVIIVREDTSIARIVHSL